MTGDELAAWLGSIFPGMELLLVDATVVDPPSPRATAARTVLTDPEALRELGIGLVVYPDGRTVDTGAPAPGWPPAGVALFALWCCAPLLSLCRRSQ